MTAEQAEHVLDPFYTTRAKDGGAGLGLAMAHGSVTDHGGAIALETSPGQGTRVTIEIPALGTS